LPFSNIQQRPAANSGVTLFIFTFKCVI
jgi:hypothetical protein